MACPFTGTVSAAETLNEKASASSTSEHEYGLDTTNFHPLFLSEEFKPEGMRKIVQEGILLAGGATAILLQVASPGVGAGVNRHSNFAYRVEDRLRTTMTFVYAMSFGTREEKEAIIRMVNAAHAPVKGKDYSADDADLQVWVAATLYATGTDLYEKLFGKFDEATSEQIYKDYAVLACALRVPPEMWPKTRADFWVYWDKMVSTATVTDDAKSVGKDLLHNKNYPLWVKINMPMLRLATAEWLPPNMREPYGFKEKSSWRTLQYKILYALTKATYPHLPRRVRFFPMNYYLKDMRKRLAAGEHVIGPGEKTTSAIAA